MRLNLEAAARYVVLSPVRARIAKRATDWRWSSVHAHLGRGPDDQITDTAPLRSRIADFAAFIATGEDEDLSIALRRAETIGRPLGDDAFLGKLEKCTGRALKPGKPGPKLPK